MLKALLGQQAVCRLSNPDLRARHYSWLDVSSHRNWCSPSTHGVRGVSSGVMTGALQTRTARWARRSPNPIITHTFDRREESRQPPRRDAIGPFVHFCQRQDPPLHHPISESGKGSVFGRCHPVLLFWPLLTYRSAHVSSQSSSTSRAGC